MTNHAPTTRTGRGPLEEDTAFGGAFDQHLRAMEIGMMPVNMEIDGIRVFDEKQYVVLSDGRTARVITGPMTLVQFNDGTLAFVGHQMLGQIMSADEIDAYTAAELEKDELRRNGAGQDYDGVEDALDGRR